MKKPTNSISFDWRTKYLEAGYERAAKQQKKGPPDKEDYKKWAWKLWGDFIQEVLAHFYAGVQWFMVPWPPENEDDLADWEDKWFGGNGRPVTFYDEQFTDRLCELATQYGEFADAYTAKLYLGLADRYLKRGEWVLGVLRSMFFELPDLPAEMVNDYYELRCGLPPGVKPVVNSERIANPQLALF